MRRALVPVLALAGGALAGWGSARFLPYAVSNAALSFALLLFVGIVAASFMGGTRKWALAVAAAAGFAAFWSASALTNASIDRLGITHARAQAILDAIDSYTRDRRAVPSGLYELVPTRLPAIPATGWGDAFLFERGSGWYRLSFRDGAGVRHGFHSGERQWRAE